MTLKEGITRKIHRDEITEKARNEGIIWRIRREGITEMAVNEGITETRI